MSQITNIINDIRSTVNEVCSEPVLSGVFKRLTNSLYGVNGFMARPIGIVGKNYNVIKNTLSRNIGDNNYSFDGYGTPISALGNPDLNTETNPWYLLDDNKNAYDNYMRYMDAIYFNGYMASPNFMSQEKKARLFNYNSLLLENNQVGVIRNYDIADSVLASTLFANGVQTNPNSFTDTRLGIINNFYLNATLQNSYYNQLLHSGSTITSNLYDTFGFFGERGLKNGEYSLLDYQVTPQEALTDNILQSTPINGTFGEYDSIINSENLIGNSNLRTQQFILKSLLGYDLLSSTDVVWSDDDVVDYSKITGKQYFPKKNKSYLSRMANSVDFDNDLLESNKIRYNITDIGNGHSTTSRVLYTYAESEGNKKMSSYSASDGRTWNQGIEYGQYTPYGNGSNLTKNDIISYTNACFNLGKMDTLIARFHTDELGSNPSRDMISSAISKYGMSHGRNLLKKELENVNGYSNPYCRVWTFHHQYSQLKDLIRPLYGNSTNIANTIIGDYQLNRDRLEKYGVKDKTNRLVRIAPTEKNEIKNCMFSIENLAWKYETKGFSGHEDQKGPLGGRIMWFPPYDLKFTENVNVNWNPTQFIGRGESIYTFTNTERSGTLSFKILIDHPSLINKWRDESSENTNGSVDDIESTEQKILRFFAGCEVLSPEVKQEVRKVEAPPLPQEPEPEPILVPHKESSSVYFYVFYPNNYSGLDDSAKGFVKPMEYIANGIGCQKDNNQNDIGTSLSIKYLKDGNLCGGYEMGNRQNGISCGLSSSTTSVTFDNGTIIGSYKHIDKNGKQKRWGYRVDETFANEVFRNPNSYYDETNYGLNSNIGFERLTDYHTDAKNLSDNSLLFSFADVLCALEPEAKQILDETQYSSNNVEILTQLFEEYDVKSVEANGYASSHGYTTNNNKLNVNRAKTVLSWLNACKPSKFTKSKCKVTKTGIGTKLTHNNVSAMDAKVWRCVKVKINLEKEELIEQQAATSSTDAIKIGSGLNSNQKISQDLTSVGASSTQNAIDVVSQNAQENLVEANNNSDSNSTNSTQSKGYGNEYEFFSRLEKEEPFLHNRIVDKIKYFDPAFHSITPEGFNARLTFLHQCTRQGNTNSAIDTSTNKTASNLSFGAPPICVLRVGDFYYTKIIIDSLSIDYDDMSWDLNDEGIGVMPMLANISISFKFLGGSDLTGPITRLQNAVSFNYYANTVVYDDRSEMIEYDKDGKIINFKSQK